MVYETKVGKLGGSSTVTIPLALVKLLEIEKGDKLVWDVNIKNEGAVVTVTPKKTDKE